LGLSALDAHAAFKSVRMVSSEGSLVLIGGASPVIAGFGLAALTGDKAMILDLFRRLVDWRRFSGGCR